MPSFQNDEPLPNSGLMFPIKRVSFTRLWEATRPMYDLDRSTRVAMRKTIQNKLRETRTQLAHELQTGSDETKPEKQAEREQLHVLADYATGIQTALNLEGKLPFEYPGLAGYEALTQIEKRFASWITSLTQLAASHSLSDQEQDCLLHFLKITAGLRPHLIQCYDLAGFPRTNNDMEGSIRSLKTRYRRVSGRKNWNSYLLRYGRCIAYYDW